jgi:hypothetical protein
MSKYADREFNPGVAAGVAARPEVLTAGGVKGIGKIVFTGNLIADDTVTVNSVVFTAKAAAAPAVGKIVFTGNIIEDDTVTINGVVFTAKDGTASGELQFDIGVSLSASLDALITKLNACTDPLVSYATYTKTDTNTAVTSTSDTNNPAHNAVVLASDHVSVVVTQPVGGVAAATAVQFDVAGSLSLSLDALVTKLNASVNPLVSIATYSKTDTNTALTATMDSFAASYNGTGFPLASDHDSVVVTAVAGGQDIQPISVAVRDTVITLDQAVNQAFTLADGVEGQELFIILAEQSGAGDAVVTPANLAGGTTLTFDAAGEMTLLKFMHGEWHPVVDTSTLA